MAVRNAQSESKPFVFNIAGAGEKGADLPIYGIIANVQPNSQASAMSLNEWNTLLGSGKVTMAPYERKERDHTEFLDVVKQAIGGKK